MHDSLSSNKFLIALILPFILLSHTAVEAQEYNGFNEFVKRDALPNLFSKVNNHDHVKIAYMGGSITQQDGYRVHSFNWFKENFPGTEFEEIVAAIGGTTSKFGVFRLYRDVLRFNPDLFFVEFAVNDLGLTEGEIKKSMEGIVRQTWKYDPNIDICFVYTARCSMFNDYQNSSLPIPVRIMEEVANHYGIPTINMGLIPAKMEAEGRLICQGSLPADPLKEPIVYSKDGIHPHEASGHVLYANAISRSMLSVKDIDSTLVHTMPQYALSPNNYENATMVVLEESMLHDPWTNITDSMASIIRNYKCTSILPTWKGYTEQSYISAEFTGNMIGIYHIAGPTAGRMDVSIDNGSESTHLAFDKYSTYHRPAQVFFSNDMAYGKHHIKITVNTNDFDKRSVIHPNRRDDYDNNPGKYENNFLNAVGLLVNGSVVSNTVYIDPGALENGGGSITSPFNTWENISWEKGNIYLQKRGTSYDKPLVIGSGGTPDSTIQIGAYGSGFNPRVVTSDTAALIASGINHFGIRDIFFSVKGIRPAPALMLEDCKQVSLTNIVIDSSGGRGIYAHRTDSLELRRSLIANCGLTAGEDTLDNISLVNSKGFLVEENIIRDFNGGNGLRVSDGKGQIRYNRIYNSESSENSLHGIMLDKQSETLVQNNLVYDNSTGAAFWLGASARVFNNTFYNCRQGMVVDRSTGDIKNNILAGNTTGINYRQYPVESDYNLYYDNTLQVKDKDTDRTLEQWQGSSGEAYDLHSIEANPVFIDADNGNFGLTKGSGAIDKGVNLDSVYRYTLDTASVWPGGVMTLDQDELGKQWDIGAYGFVLSYTLSTAATNGTITPSGGTFIEGTELTLKATPDEGYMFDGWNGDMADTENPVTLIMDRDTSISAGFAEAVEFRLSGINCRLEPSGGTYRKGTQVSIRVIPHEGFEFWGWKKDLSGNANPLQLKLDSSLTLQAVCTIIPVMYALQTESDHGTIIPSDTFIEENTLVTMQAIPDSGYVFDYWNGDTSLTADNIQFYMSQDTVIKAQFAEAVMLRVLSENGKVMPDSGVFKKNTIVTLTAIADSGYRFMQWQGDMNDSLNPVNLKLDEDKQIEAIFSKITGIHDLLSISDIKVYPNPASDRLTIDLSGNAGFSGSTLEIYNSMGKKMEDKLIIENTTINLENYDKGMYILKIKHPLGKIYTEKILNVK